ncbi:homoserine dehydrogenase [soil metagenome]
MATALNLVHVGLGLIGTSAIRQLQSVRDRWRTDHGIDLIIRSFIDSSGGVCCDDQDGYVDATIDRILAGRAAGAKVFHAAPSIGLTPRTAHDAVALAIDMGGPTVVLDCATGADTAALSERVLDAGGGAVFSNKAPLALPLVGTPAAGIWNDTGMFGRMRYETSCGAGLPVISSIQSLIASGDEVMEISGALSGTLGAIFAAVENGSSFSQAVFDARSRGYTEPDPRDDLSGLDVGRKALILARTIGMPLDLDEISIESLVPESLATCSIDQFMTDITSVDADIAARSAEASGESRTLRYVATVNPASGVEVGMRPVDQNTILGSLQGPQNVITIRTNRYDQYPLTIAGPGAGAEVTAAGVVADILSVAHSLKG